MLVGQPGQPAQGGGALHHVERAEHGHALLVVREVLEVRRDVVGDPAAVVDGAPGLEAGLRAPPQRRVGTDRHEGGQPAAQPVQGPHGVLHVREAQVHVHAADVLVRGDRGRVPGEALVALVHRDVRGLGADVRCGGHAHHVHAHGVRGLVQRGAEVHERGHGPGCVVEDRGGLLHLAREPLGCGRAAARLQGDQLRGLLGGGTGGKPVPAVDQEELLLDAERAHGVPPCWDRGVGAGAGVTARRTPSPSRRPWSRRPLPLRQRCPAGPSRRTW